jgi:predicted esterase
MQVLFTTADSETSLAAERPVIVIQNNTGGQIVTLKTKKAATDILWNDVPNLASYFPGGAIQAFTLPTLLSVNDMYDFLATGMFANIDTFIKRNIKVTDGMVLIFDDTDKQ